MNETLAVFPPTTGEGQAFSAAHLLHIVEDSEKHGAIELRPAEFGRE